MRRVGFTHGLFSPPPGVELILSISPPPVSSPFIHCLPSPDFPRGLQHCCGLWWMASGLRQRKRGQMRVTLLVNVWLSHKPEGVATLPADVAVTLSSRGASSSPLLCFDRPVALFPVSIGKENEALVRRQEADGVSVGGAEGSTMVINAPLGPTISLELRAPRPESLSVGRLKALHSFSLLCREGRLARIKARHEGGASRVARVDCPTIEEGSMDEERCERRGGGLVQGDVGREVGTEAGRISRKRKK